MSKRLADLWTACKAGESFFVPSLDPMRTARMGLFIGGRVHRRSRLHYRVGIYKGVLGVLFTLR